MKVALFSTQHFEPPFFMQANEKARQELRFNKETLRQQTAPMVHGFPAVCACVNDKLDAATLRALVAGARDWLLCVRQVTTMSIFPRPTSSRKRLCVFPLTRRLPSLGEEQGLVKVIFDSRTGQLLGAHMVGAEVTELIQGYVVAMNLETTEEELMRTVFPHPTLSEAMHEAVLDAYGRALNI
jgi:hypothetical protein